MTSRSLTLRIRYTLSVDLLAGVEREPVVRFYLSKPLSSELITVTALAGSGATASERRVDLTFPLSSRHLGASTTLKQIADFLPQCSLNIDCYAKTLTKIDEWVRKLVGTASVDLATVMCNSNSAVALSLRLPTAPTECADKGTITVSVDDMYLQQSDTKVSVFCTTTQARRAALELAQQTKALREKAQLILNQYIHGSHRLYTAVPSSLEATRNVGFYVWTDRDGILPAMFYATHEHPDCVEVEYLENALRLVLASERVSAEELLARAPHDPLLASVVKQMCSMYTRYAYYSSDEAYLRDRVSTAAGNPLRHVDLEQMLIVEHTDADDCEGLAYKIVRDLLYLLRCVPRDMCSPLLQRLIDVRRHYVGQMLLGGVASSEISGSFASLAALNEIGAHMYEAMMTRARLVEMMKRCNHSDGVLGSLSWEEERIIEESAAYTPLLIGEGTGVLAPLPIEVPEVKRLVLPSLPRASTPAPTGTTHTVVYGDRTRVLSVTASGRDHGAALFGGMSPNNAAFSNNSLFVSDMLQESYEEAFHTGLRKWYHWRLAGDSHFYRTVKSLVVPELLQEGYGIGAFAVMRRTDDVPPRWSVGCTFQEFVSNDPRVALWPQAPVDQVEMAAAHLLMENVAPVPPVCAPNSVRAKAWDPTRDDAITPETIARIEATLERFRLAAHVHAVYVALRNHYDPTTYNTVLGGVNTLLSAQEIDRLIATTPKLAEAARRLSRGKVPLATGAELVASLEAARARGSSMPVLATYFFNYQQAQRERRIRAIETAIDSTAVLQEDAVANSGQRDISVYVDIVGVEYAHEQVTSTVGGYRVHFAVQMSYRS